MKNWDSITVCLFLLLFFVSQIRVSTISRLLEAIPTKRDQETTLPALDPHPSPALVSPIVCNRSHPTFDICSIDGPTVLDPKGPTFYVVGHANSPHQVEKIRPHPRKWDIFKMAHIKELTLTTGPQSPACTAHHTAPALVFSVGGYSGNIFTDFSDEFIPLFITVNSIISGDKDFILAISNARDWWIWKYADLIKSFSKHPIINLDNDTATHCFPSATIGLITIDPKLIPNSKTILRFHELLEKTYGGRNHDLHRLSGQLTTGKSRPRLVLAGRRTAIGRAITNRDAVRKMAEEEGFDVVDFEPNYGTSMRESHALVSSSHAMVGVHGAALIHLLFLRPGAVFVQVVPLGTDWLAEVCFGNLARDMGLEYVEYKIGVEESSLAERYGNGNGKDGDDETVVKDPEGFMKKKGGWTSETVEKYLKEQNVRLDLVRFRGYLKKAFLKAKAFMDKEG